MPQIELPTTTFADLSDNEKTHFAEMFKNNVLSLCEKDGKTKEKGYMIHQDLTVKHVRDYLLENGESLPVAQYSKNGEITWQFFILESDMKIVISHLDARCSS